MDRSPEFDAWLLRRAREKPKNPIYAHLQARAALEAGEEGQKRGGFVAPGPLPVAVCKSCGGSGILADPNRFGEPDQASIRQCMDCYHLSATVDIDNKSRAAGEEAEIVGEWDGCEIIEGEE